MPRTATICRSGKWASAIFKKNGGAGRFAADGSSHTGLLIRRDQSYALVVPPDVDGMAIEVLAGFNQHGVVVLALGDARRTENPAFPIELVQAICNHEQNPENSATSHDESGFVRII